MPFLNEYAIESLDEYVAADAYLMRRLSVVSRSDLPASVQFDLARSPMSDDELDQAIGVFGTPSASGWGFSEVFEDLLSRDPKRIPVRDLVTFQENLKKQGYVPPDREVTGEWDSGWYGAFRRMDADSKQQQMSGGHWASTPVEAGLRLITNSLPTSVWQGIVGGAKGLVEQTPETVERVGALGGAVAGAAIGAGFGGAGIVPGAIIGASVGFLADLFSK